MAIRYLMGTPRPRENMMERMGHVLMLGARMTRVAILGLHVRAFSFSLESSHPSLRSSSFSFFIRNLAAGRKSWRRHR